MKNMVSIFCLILPIYGYAGLSQDMNDFFESSGMVANVTAAGAYKGQMAGLYTGGQIYARNQVKTVYPAHIRLPSYSAGCGGIDAFTGSFSFISGNELKETLITIAQGAGSYAFLLGMETVSPQITGIQKHLSNLANAVNRANINSCEAASGLVGGLWPKTQLAQNQICTSAGVSGGYGSDYADAKQACAKGKTSKILENKKTKENYGDMILHNKNISWETIHKLHSTELNRETKEMLMTLSGTLIVKGGGNSNDQEAHSVVNLPTQVNNLAFVRSLLHGGGATVYQCDEPIYCLNPSVVKTVVTPEKSFHGMVLEKLKVIRAAIADDTPLKQSEISFLGSTTIPIYKMLNVEYAMKSNSDILNINGLSEIIATDFMFQYLSENLEMMRAASQSLDLGEENLKKYRDSIDMARKFVTDQRKSIKMESNHRMNAIKQTEYLERTLAGKLSSHLSGVIGSEGGI